ncbi:decaprenyl-phosphate phosphoribosyltransferase [Kitasatospora sp. MY 5-36]|uniref:decaprenyl-phosphate phosphoribosyltransferase n=1 Tax=Kitasatospora sp. MY 5-36 TaxID=1678027 RepID=UPI00069E5941|nr:decaprenyl-phosphate phosphoribosyltransferase [Kitasatospora sp. MY 5-36]
MSTASEYRKGLVGPPVHPPDGATGPPPADLPEEPGGSGLPGEPRRGSLVRGLLRLVRPFQWPKNAVVLVLPLLASGASPWPAVADALPVLVLFVLASSATYVVNDLADRERDRRHPVKRHRPIASGAVPVPVAIVLGAVLYLALLAGSAAAGAAAVPVLVYAVTNILYSFVLKHVSVVDVSVIATGFVLRVCAGAMAASVPISSWFLLCVFSVCILLGFGKRRHELTSVQGGPSELHRPALRAYSVPFLNSMVTFAASVTVLAYVSFLQSDAAAGGMRQLRILLSTPLAVFAIARYLQILLVSEGGGEPTRTLFTDRTMLAVGGLWLTGFGLLLAVQSW